MIRLWEGLGAWFGLTATHDSMQVVALFPGFYRLQLFILSFLHTLKQVVHLYYAAFLLVLGDPLPMHGNRII